MSFSLSFPLSSSSHPSYRPLAPPTSASHQNQDLKTLNGSFSIKKFTLILYSILIFIILTMAIIAIRRLEDWNRRRFEAVSSLGTPLGKLDDIDSYVVLCSNSSLGNETIEYKGKTQITKQCDPIENACISSICLPNMTCSFQYKHPAFNCVTDNDCDIGMSCVGCICSSDQPCSSSDDCPKIEWTDCIENICFAGFCEQVFTAGSTCATAESCSDIERCRNCQCISGAEDSCENDGECEMVEWSDCIAPVCDMGTCFDRLLPNATCVSSADCDDGFICQGCNCEVSPQCSQNISCGEILWTTCIENVCMSGICQENLTSGSQCFEDDGCSPGFQCKNCTCVEKDVQCIEDEDCPLINYTTCLENICLNEACIPVLKSTSQCSDSSLCATGDVCDTNCQCNPSMNFIIIESGVASVSGGGAIFDLNYTLYGSSSLRRFFYAPLGTSTTTSSTGGLLWSTSIPVGSRPSATTYFRVSILHTLDVILFPSQGYLTISGAGQIIWMRENADPFLAGRTVGLWPTSIEWFVP